MTKADSAVVPEPEPCRLCKHGQAVQVIATDLKRIRLCRRFPPNVPMPGPGGQGVVFWHPFVNDEGHCGEFGEVTVSVP